MIFKPSPAIEIPSVQKGRRYILADKESMNDFWEEFNRENDPILKEGIGCYIFSIKAAKGALPWYVEKTEKSFEKECFTADKLKNTTIFSRIETEVFQC